MAEDYNDIKERVRSLEVTNQFHQESLSEISKTLKEVVRTQAMLANQREQIVKIAESLEGITKSLHEQDKKLSEHRFSINEIEKDFSDLLAEYQKTKQKTESNTRFVKVASWVLTGILVPIILAVINGIL